MNKNLLIAVAVIILLGGGYMLVKNSSVAPVDEIENKEDLPDVKIDEEKSAKMEKEGESETMDEADEADIFNLEASSFKFNVKEIRVKQGTQVKIVLTNKQGFHDFVIDEFNARTKQLSEGQKETIEFTADKKGTFEYYCSVGQHRQNGMVGKLIVE